MANNNAAFFQDLERMKRDLAALDGKKISVGIHAQGDGEILKYAAIHEFGGTINAKNVKNLAIPLTKEAKQKGTKGFNDLFVIVSKNKNVLLVRKKGGTTLKSKPRGKRGGKASKPAKQQDLELLFTLKPSVKIPERSYIRASFDEGQGELDNIVAGALDNLLANNADAETTLNRIGEDATEMTQGYINDGKVKPAKGGLQSKLSTQDTTLYDQGHLVGSIAYKVE